MKRAGKYITIVLILTGYLSCKKVFAPALNTVSTNFLAVDGPILSGDSTFITLSRTTKLSDTTQNKMELKAAVSVEDDQAKLYPLSEKGKGKYVLAITNFNPARKYRLDIKTADGKIYQSDFVPMKVTPPIDSIYIKQTSDATVLFYVNAHDATNSTRYYRWDYKETWSYVSLYQDFVQYKGGQILPVVPDSPDDVFICYRAGYSNEIAVGSSAKLANDVIANLQIGGLAAGSEKIGHVYVMQLRQYALTEAGFNYYQNLKSNTEQVGSIFDAQASTLIGNIHCITSPTDLVIGFVSASTVTTKQHDLHANDLQLRVPDLYGAIAWFPPYYYYSSYYFPLPDTTTCHVASFFTPPYSALPQLAMKHLGKGDSVLMLRGSGSPGDSYPAFIMPDAGYGNSYGFVYAPKNCVDCRTKGGTNIRPSYFPYPAY